MRAKILGMIIAICVFQTVHADVTDKGKIISTMGHIGPSCRMLVHRENGTGTQRTFRIANVDGDDDVNAIAIAALVGGRDVVITYVPETTTGCGTEPGISYITIY